jgi:thioredoxin-related protein
MKFIRLTIFSILLSLSAFAQNPHKGIQVTLEDTIQITPDNYELAIFKQETYDYSEDPSLIVKKKDDFKNTVEGYLKKNNLKSSNITFYNSRGENLCYKVSLTNKEYRTFINDFRNSGLVTFSIVKKESQKISEYEGILAERLIQQAKSRGEHLAKLSGLKLDKIENVEESMYKDGGYSGGWSVYPPFSENPHHLGLTFGNSGEEKIVIRKSLKVYFAAN